MHNYDTEYYFWGIGCAIHSWVVVTKGKYITVIGVAQRELNHLCWYTKVMYNLLSFLWSQTVTTRLLQGSSILLSHSIFDKRQVLALLCLSRDALCGEWCYKRHYERRITSLMFVVCFSSLTALLRLSASNVSAR